MTDGIVSTALFFALIVAVIAGLITLLSGEAMEAHRSPNQGTQRSKGGDRIGRAVWSDRGLAWGLFFRATSDPRRDLDSSGLRGFVIGEGFLAASAGVPRIHFRSCEQTANLAYVA